MGILDDIFKIFRFSEAPKTTELSKEDISDLPPSLSGITDGVFRNPFMILIFLALLLLLLKWVF